MEREPRDLTALACPPHAPPQETGGFASRISRGLLRMRMIRKARRGKYDRRMFAYWGVDWRVNRGCRGAVRRGMAGLLVPTSSRRWPVCTSCSYHQRRNRRDRGKAVDLGNIAQHVGPTAEGRRRLVRYQKAEFAAWRRGDRPHMIELIGPDNHAIVLGGRHVPLGEGGPLETQHDNHVHQAFLV